MLAFLRIWSTVRAVLRTCAGSLSADAGDTLIEVMVAASLLVVISVGSLTGFDAANRRGADEKRHSQANQLAQQDQDRLRGLQVAQLTGSEGNQIKTYTLDGTGFTVTSSSTFVSDNNAGASCSSTGTGNADYIKTSSTVTWPNMAPRAPVVQEGIITPPAGGSMLVQVNDQNNNPVSGVAVNVTGTGAGTTPRDSATTDSYGCTIFGGLIDGAYSLATTKSGFVDPGGTPSPTSAQTVVAGATDTVPLLMGQAGSITNVSFQSYWGGVPRATAQDTFIAANPGVPAPGFRLFGTPNTFVGSITTPSTVYPFTTPYNLYVGSCIADNPLSNGQASGYDPTVSVPPGGPPSPTSVILRAPALLVEPYSGTSGTTTMVGYPANNSTTSTVPNHVTVTDNTCNGKRVYTGAQLTTPTGPSGALVDPGQPFGSFTVCADYTGRSSNGLGGWNYFYEHQTATSVANNSPNGTTVPLYFGAYQAGLCP